MQERICKQHIIYKCSWRKHLVNRVLGQYFLGLVSPQVAHIPGISVLVSDHFGPLTGGKLLEDLQQLEVVHLGG